MASSGDLNDAFSEFRTIKPSVEEQKYLQSCRMKAFYFPAALGVASWYFVRRQQRLRIPPISPLRAFAMATIIPASVFAITSSAGAAACVNGFLQQRDFPIAAAVRQRVRRELSKSGSPQRAPFDVDWPDGPEHDKALLESIAINTPKQERPSTAVLDDNLAQAEAKIGTTRPLTTYERSKIAGDPTHTHTHTQPVSAIPTYDRDQQSVTNVRGIDSQVKPERLWGNDITQPKKDITSPPIRLGDAAPARGSSWDRLRAQRESLGHATSTNVTTDDFNTVDVDLEKATVDELRPTSSTSTSTSSTIRAVPRGDQPKGRMKKNEFGEEVWVEDE